MLDYDNFIFDLYGTLIDLHTDETCDDTWIKWCDYLDEQNIKHPPIDSFRSQFFALDKAYRKSEAKKGLCDVVEIDIVDVYRELFLSYGNEPFSDARLSEIGYEFRVASCEYIQLFPGVIEFLSMLRDTGRKAFILSNAQRAYTYPEILKFDLDKLTIDQLISSDYKCMKPDVKFFNALIEKHSLDRGRTVMLGDSLKSDIKGAKASGLSYIHLIKGNSPQHFYVDNLFGLL